MKSSYYDGSKGTTIDLMGPLTYEGTQAWLITRVEVHRSFRGRGYAREMMTRVCTDADLEQETLLLAVEPDGTGADKVALKRFYGSLGFVYMAEDTMIRSPKG